MSKKKHLEILDAYAKQELDSHKQALSIAFHEYKRLKEEFNTSNLDAEERARELSFLEYEIKEIEEAALRVGEDDELEEEFKRFSNGRKILEAANYDKNVASGIGGCCNRKH